MNDEQKSAETEDLEKFKTSMQDLLARGILIRIPPEPEMNDTP